jgi:C4-dicarboxylate-specific signal transduction histidine kinase
MNRNGDTHLIAIAVEPITHGNEFCGVIGVDVDLAFLQIIADKISIFNNSGKMSVVSNNGTVAAFTGSPEQISQQVGQVYQAAGALPQRIRSGEEITEISNGLLYAFAPFTLCTLNMPWSVGIVVPVDNIIEAPIALMWKQIIIFGGITVVMLVAVFFGALSVTRPLSTLLQGMKSIRNGDFSHSLTVRTHDEIGELANVFNLMRKKIEKMLQELHQHQEKLEEKVLQRTMQLKEKNRELNKANEELYLAMDAIQEAQEKLLQNEKLAIVGQMSGIVAHEVLNPVSAVSIRVETNIEQARRTLAVIEKMHDIMLAAERDFQDKADKQEEIIAELRKQFPLIVKIGVSLKKNQEARLEDLYFLEKQMNRIVRIVDNLRQMSKTKKDIEPVSLNKLINEVLEDMGDGLRKRKVLVKRELAPVPPLNADHTELYSIISNLVRNAMQAVEKTPKTSERIITVQLIHRDDDFLELEVQDNGAGVEPELRNSIFEPGFTSRGRKGTGLGLSFSRKIARSYHGDLVLLDRKPGTGTAFQVLLPLHQENV